MDEDDSDRVNLDLNLGPRDGGGSGEESISNHAGGLNVWECEAAGVGQAVARLRAYQLRNQIQDQVPDGTLSLSVEMNQLMGDVTTSQTGEGSVPPNEGIHESPKVCELNYNTFETDISGKKDDANKGSGCDGNFFDCNICFDLAKDPVVTCCGHLYCWSCIYQWLHVHSEAKECPVCKGEVTVKSLTPIYGRGCGSCEPQDDLSNKIPLRPNARRVESLRQSVLRLPTMVQMIRQVQSRFDSEQNVPERATSLVRRLWRSRDHEEQTILLEPAEPSLTQHISTNAEHHPASLPPLRIRRLSRSHRSSRPYSVSSATRSSEAVIHGYYDSVPLVWHQEQNHVGGSGHDSVSSIVGRLETPADIDSRVSLETSRMRNDVTLSTSSSRRGADLSRLSDIDSADSLPPRRRRRLS